MTRKYFVRRDTEPVRCGQIMIGGGAPISIQTMTKTDTRDAAATIEEIKRAVDAGAEIVRVAVPDAQAAEALTEIKHGTSCPIVADIHFDYRLAIASIEAGADKVRINPEPRGMDNLLLVTKSAPPSGGPP